MVTQRSRSVTLMPPALRDPVLVTAVCAGVVAAGSAAVWGSPVMWALLAIAIGVVAVCLSVGAVRRFETFVLSLLLVRPSLDILPGAGPVDPSSMLALLFIVAAVVWLARRGGRTTTPSPVTWAFGALAAAAVVSCITSPLPVASAIAASKTVAGVTMLVVVEQMLRERPERARRLVTVVLASAAVPVLVALLQMGTAGGGLQDETIGISRVVGTFAHPNPFATFLAMVLVLGVAVLPHLRTRHRLLVLALLGLSSVALMGTFGRGGWIAAAIGIGYLIAVRSKVLLLLSAVLVGVLGATVPAVRDRFADIGAPPPVPGVPANSLEWRFGYWQEVLPLVRRNPLTGIGFEAVQNTSDSGLPPHNAYVQALVELGLLGLLALLAVITTTAFALRRRVRLAEPGLDRALATAAVAIGLGLLAQTLTENLLSQTMAFWYFAAAGTLGLPTGRRVGSGETSAVDDLGGSRPAVPGGPVRHADVVRYQD